MCITVFIKDTRYFSISSSNLCSFIFRGPLESINYGHRDWRLLRGGESYPGRGPPLDRSPPALLNEKCFRAFCPLVPLFVSDVFKDTVLIGPCVTFCEFRLRKSNGKTVFFSRIRSASFPFHCCLLAVWLYLHYTFYFNIILDILQIVLSQMRCATFTFFVKLMLVYFLLDLKASLMFL